MLLKNCHPLGGLAAGFAFAAGAFAQGTTPAQGMPNIATVPEPAQDLPSIATVPGKSAVERIWSLNYEYYRAEQDWNVFRQAQIIYPDEIWDTNRKREAIYRGVGFSWGPEAAIGTNLLAASLDLGFRWADDQTNSRAQDRVAGTRTAPGTANPGFGVLSVAVDTSDLECYVRLRFNFGKAFNGWQRYWAIGGYALRVEQQFNYRLNSTTTTGAPVSGTPVDRQLTALSGEATAWYGTLGFGLARKFEPKSRFLYFAPKGEVMVLRGRAQGLLSHATLAPDLGSGTSTAEKDVKQWGVDANATARFGFPFKGGAEFAFDAGYRWREFIDDHSTSFGRQQGPFGRVVFAYRY